MDRRTAGARMARSLEKRGDYALTADQYFRRRQAMRTRYDRLALYWDQVVRFVDILMNLHPNPDCQRVTRRESLALPFGKVALDSETTRDAYVTIVAGYGDDGLRPSSVTLRYFAAVESDVPTSLPIRTWDGQIVDVVAFGVERSPADDEFHRIMPLGMTLDSLEGLEQRSAELGPMSTGLRIVHEELVNRAASAPTPS